MESEIEIWKDAKGFEGYYQVSNMGNMRRAGSDVNLKPVPCTCTKYYKQHLSVLGKVTCVSVHRMVALTFIENPDNKRCVNHKDFNRKNNVLLNLEWVTHLENELHKCKAGRGNVGEKNGQSKLNRLQAKEIKNKIKQGFTSREIALQYSVSTSCVKQIRANRNWAFV